MTAGAPELNRADSERGSVMKPQRPVDDPTQMPVAISVKQPWAALIVAGLKTVEVRTWPTRRRGAVLIHAGKVADDRPEGWDRISTPHLREAAELRGGVIGVAEIAACRGYA